MPGNGAFTSGSWLPGPLPSQRLQCETSVRRRTLVWLFLSRAWKMGCGLPWERAWPCKLAWGVQKEIRRNAKRHPFPLNFSLIFPKFFFKLFFKFFSLQFSSNFFPETFFKLFFTLFLQTFYFLFLADRQKVFLTDLFIYWYDMYSEPLTS